MCPDHQAVVVAVCFQAGEGRRGEQHGGDGSAFDSKGAHRKSETSSGATVWASTHTHPGLPRSIGIATRKNSVDVEHFGLPVGHQEDPPASDTETVIPFELSG